MTSTTPNHDVYRCHKSSEDRRLLLCRLRCLAERLDDCDRAAMMAAGCGDLFNCGGKTGGRFCYPDPADAPLITYPENSEREEYKVTECRKTPAWELKGTKSQELIAGYMTKGCICPRRNGLQDQCELSQCQGRPLCLTTPIPLCPPSGGAALLVTPTEAATIIDMVDRDRCCRLSCCHGLVENC